MNKWVLGKFLCSINILMLGIHTLVWFSLLQLSENMFERVNEIEAELALENQRKVERQWLANIGRHWEGRKEQVLLESLEWPFMGIEKITTKTWFIPDRIPEATTKERSVPRPGLIIEVPVPWPSGFTRAGLMAVC